MGTAFNGIDVVGEGHHGFSIGVVVLNGYLCGGIPLLCLHVDNGVQHFAVLAGIQIIYVALNAAFIVKNMLNILAPPFIPEDDLDACRPKEKRPWVISLGVSAWPVHAVLTAPIPVYC